MVNLIIDNKHIEVPAGTTLLDAAKQNGVNIPHLCYLEDINEIGACRVCVVEIEGISRLVTACNNVVEEGMVVFTNSPKVREARRTNVEFILSQHKTQCTTCVRSGNCSLQTMATNLGILEIPYKEEFPKDQWDKNFPLIRDSEKCIKCMRCVQICDKVQSLGIWDITNTGSRTTVSVARNGNIQEADCALCGQCVTHCPVGALRARDDTQKVFKALADPNLITIVQIAPAVRASWGENLGLSKEYANARRLVSAMRQMGFDYIFDTTFSADLTIMEEGSEFLEKLKNKETETFPLFTSCCPGWVRFMRTQYPEMIDQLSTAKSPQQMFGSITKTYFAEMLGVDPSRIFNISVMPCIAKKYEAGVSVLNVSEPGPDVDVVLTTREIDRLIRAEHINLNALEEEEFDEFLGIGSGAGVIFGATGGVMEAALRSAYYLVTGSNPEPDAFMSVRGMSGWKEAEFDLAGSKLRVAVASGLKNARNLVEAIKDGSVKYDFVEIMACPGGCSGGGGQPIKDGRELAEVRADNLYGLDRGDHLRFSHENPAVLACYENYLQKPLSHRSHELLHTDQTKWDLNVKK